MRINKIVSSLISLMFILALFLSVVDYACFDRNFYNQEYQKLNTAENIGVSDKDLKTMTDVLLDYLKYRDKTLDLKLSVKGEVREIFNQKEKDHMVDVRDLYLNAMMLRNIVLVVGVIGLIYLCITEKGQLFKNLFSGYMKALVFCLIVISALGCAIITNFDAFWTSFHHIFFTGNDLWLLDPRTDILIMMVPGTFFYDLVTRIVIFFILGIVLLALCLYLLRRLKRD